MPRVKEPWYPEPEYRKYVEDVIDYIMKNGREEGHFHCCIFDSSIDFSNFKRTFVLSSEKRMRKAHYQVFKSSRNGSGIDVRVPIAVKRTREGKVDEEPKLVNINRFVYNAFHFLGRLHSSDKKIGRNNAHLDVSHLCDRPCFNPSHLILEDRETNMSRQRCIGYIKVKKKYIKVCKHNPPCTRLSSEKFDVLEEEDMKMLLEVNCFK